MTTQPASTVTMQTRTMKSQTQFRKSWSGEGCQVMLAQMMKPRNAKAITATTQAMRTSR